MACDQELAAAGIDEQRHDGRILLHIDEHADRLAVAASARQLRHVEGIKFSVGCKQQQL